MEKLRMHNHGTNGKLITFCGLDGCGKSTMIHMVSKWLKRYGKQIYLTKQPTDFVRQSKIFRTYMDEPDHSAYDYRSLSLLAASDRVQHCHKEILPKLKEMKYVISDRYFYSCLANLRARGYERDSWIYEISQSVIKPDIAIFLDVPVEIAVSRVRSRKEEKDSYIDMDLQYRLRQEFLDIAQMNEGIIFSSDQKTEITFENIKEYLSEKIEPQKSDRRCRK